MARQFPRAPKRPPSREPRCFQWRVNLIDELLWYFRHGESFDALAVDAQRFVFHVRKFTPDMYHQSSGELRIASNTRSSVGIKNVLLLT